MWWDRKTYGRFSGFAEVFFVRLFSVIIKPNILYFWNIKSFSGKFRLPTIKRKIRMDDFLPLIMICSKKS
jgi:hypothetical protein